MSDIDFNEAKSVKTDSASVGQVERVLCMDKLRQYRENGWRFEYDPETKFVGAYHQKGGKQSICEICELRNRFANDEFGFAIAILLNGIKSSADR